MNTTSAVMLTGLLVVGGYWSQDQKLNLRIAIGVVALALFLSVLDGYSPDIAGKFAVLVLITAVFLYGPAIAKKAGLTK